MLLLVNLISNKFRIEEAYDFIVIGSDGLYDRQSNSDIIKCVFRSSTEMYFSDTK